MTKQDRPTLKSFFRSGALPTEEEYSDLIDSTVNLMDDGFAKTEVDGLQLASKGGSERVMSFYQGLGASKPSWVFDHDAKTDGILHIRPDEGKAAMSSAEAAKKAPADDAQDAKLYAPNLSLTRDGRVGVNREHPDWRLDVGGVARMEGRVGVSSHNIPAVRADGSWNFITQPMTGCQILEVVAGVGGPEGDGRYSLIRAIAMNTYQPQNALLNWIFKRRSIKAQTAMYGRYADRLRLKWENHEDKPHYYRLKIRTNADFGPDRLIRYNITRLWFDTHMVGSLKGGATFKPDRDTGLL